MLLKFRKKANNLDSIEHLGERLKESEEWRDFFQFALRASLQLVKEFTLDSGELESEAFRCEIGELSENIASESRLKKVNSLFEKGKRHVLNYADRQKTYIQDREAEFRDIIDILTRAMVILDSDNRTFNRQILEQSDRIERISRLDDIKKIKQALLEGVEEIRQTARNKQSRDMDKLASLSEQVQVLHHQLEEARRESERDGLTGIYNRKAFDEYLSGLVEKNTVVKQPFALLMLDIDNFKAINDTHGHQVGDRVILAVVNKCRQHIRSEDYLARYGGEEFAAVLPGASLKNAWKKADLIRSAIGATRYVIEGMHEENAIAVTVSGGVSVYRKADTRETVTRRADQALYVAKLSGKNCIVSEKDASGKNFPPVTATG